MINSNTIENTTIGYLPKLNPKIQIIYLLICFFITVAIGALPFLHTDVAIKSQGIVRPNSERTEIKPITSGTIDRIFVKEGQSVLKDSLIVRLKDNTTIPKKILNDFEVTQHMQYIHDLELLSSSKEIKENILNKIQSPVYKQQISQFIYRISDQEVLNKKGQT